MAAPQDAASSPQSPRGFHTTPKWSRYDSGLSSHSADSLPDQAPSTWSSMLNPLKRSFQGMTPRLGPKRRTSEELITGMGVEDPGRIARMWTRNLLLIVVYYVLGAAVYTHLEERPCDDQPAGRTAENVAVDTAEFQCENCTCFEPVGDCSQSWTILDAVYWVTVTVTTVGYGDYAPATEAGRSFAFFYILFGLLFTLGAINSVVGAMLDGLQKRTVRSFDPFTPEETARSINRKAALAMVLMIGVVLIGGVAYAALEDWPFLDGAWFSFITMTTVGYGDITLERSESRVFTIFFILFNVTLMTVLIGFLSSASYQLRQERKRAELLKSSLTPAVIAALDRDGDGVDRFEFVFGMLQILEIVSEDDITPWLEKFNDLDADNSGMLDKDDLALLGYELQKEQIEMEESSRSNRYLGPLLAPSSRNAQATRSPRRSSGIPSLDRAVQGDPVGIRGIGTSGAVDPTGERKDPGNQESKSRA